MKYALKLDTGPLEKALSDIRARVDSDALSRAVLAGLFVIEAEAKLNIRARFKQRTGFFAANWETKLDEVSNKRVEGHTAPLAIYARIHELGGVIRATRGRLTFQTDDGNWHSVSAVTIPARPYFRPAIDEHSQDVSTAVGNILRELLEM